MSSAAQALANQANAQKSTGPRTPAGKSQTSRNALSHGLSASPESLFAHSPALQEEFNAFVAKLRQDYTPVTASAEILFDRWAYASFQAARARRYEILAETDMLADFGNPELERRYLRFSQHRLRLAREAEAAFKSYFAAQNFWIAAKAARQQMRDLAVADQEFQKLYGPPPLEPALQDLLARLIPPRRASSTASSNAQETAHGS